ncbi:MAG TPA: hypothetical protein VGI74_04765 [Streptosporangiaceae bacterium]|jgi:hypothetical protein
MRKPSTRALTMLATLPVFGITVFGVRPMIATPPASAAVVKAATSGACKGTAGVTVVVDFTKLGGKIVIACDPGTPKTGLDALKGAGFTFSFVPKIPGFVCRIDKLPNPCNGAPAKAFWAYSHAKAHGTWVLSNKGAGSYHPAPGTVQGWAFGASRKPGIAPPN